MPTTNKPRVFISSTVYDFQDLRSALKYWLTELGIEVLLSEHNDFPKNLEENSYESCLNAIKSADYFILLIGARTGGWFDEKNRISITRKEYRVAREHFERTGQPKLAVFVRQNLWDIREDRKALRKFIETDASTAREQTHLDPAKLADLPSRFVNDTDATFAFLEEVSQAKVMRAAQGGGTELPKGNWVHRFSEFADITAALRVSFGISAHVERRLLEENLRREMRGNLCHLLTNSGGELVPIYRLAVSATSKITGEHDGRSLLTVQDLKWILIFRVYWQRVPNLLASIFTELAVQSGTFMEFDTVSGCHKPSRAHDLLLEMLNLTASIRRPGARFGEGPYKFCDEFRHNGRDDNEEIRVRNQDLASPCSDAKVLRRITDISRGMILWLGGDRQALHRINDDWSRSVIPAETAIMKSERVAPEKVDEWIAAEGKGDHAP